MNKDKDTVEPGDLVTVVSVATGEETCHVGMVGTFDLEWVKDGTVTYTVLFDGEEFTYATEIVLYKKG